jgi:hypothetical protein
MRKRKTRIVATSYFQERIRGIPNSITKGNNAWPVRIRLCTRWISRPPIVGRKLARKKEKKQEYENIIYIILYLGRRCPYKKNINPSEDLWRWKKEKRWRWWRRRWKRRNQVETNNPQIFICYMKYAHVLHEDVDNQ